jgi:hypothetical protein
LSSASISTVSAPSVAAITITGATSTGTVAVTIDGTTYTATTSNNGTAGTRIAQTAASLVTAIENKLPGVFAISDGTDTVTIFGAHTLSTAVSTDTITTNVGLAGVTTLIPSSSAQSGTANTLPITLGNSAGTTNALDYASIVESNNQTIAITSLKALNQKTTSANVISILDTTKTVAGSDYNNPATKITISGDQATTVSYYMSGATNTATNALATIDASTSTSSINTTGVQGATTGLSITGGSGTLTAYGSGYAIGESAANFLSAVDSITIGAGGGSITLGYAGGGTGAGSTTVNLAASAAKGDTISAPIDTTYGAKAVVNGFVVSASSTTDDKIVMPITKTVIANQTTAASTAGSSGTDTWTSSNGVISFVGGDSIAQKIINAEYIVNQGANRVAAFGYGGNTYVVSSAATGSLDATHDTVVTLNGVSGITQLGGITPASGNILGASFNAWGQMVGISGTADSGGGAQTTAQDDTGASVQSVSSTPSGTHTFNNLAPSAIVNDAATSTYSLTTTQTGTSGTNSITLNTTGSHTITQASFSGDNAITINGFNDTTISNLLDPTNTATALTASEISAKTLTISAINDTALATVSLSGAGAIVLGASATPLSQNGVTVTSGSSSTTRTGANTIYASGNNDVFNLTYTSGVNTITSTGSGTKVNGGTGADVIVVGDNSTVTMAQGVSQYLLGTASFTGNAATNTITVGANSTVTLGTNKEGVATDSHSQINLWNSLTNASNTTGATSAGTYSFTTINNPVDAANGTKIQFFSTAGTGAVAGTGTLSAVNVSAASSFSSALDIAASQESGYASGTHYYDWFAYGGNTYVLEHTGTGAAVTAMSSNDILVKITGLVNLANFTVSADIVNL